MGFGGLGLREEILDFRKSYATLRNLHIDIIKWSTFSCSWFIFQNRAPYIIFANRKSDQVPPPNQCSISFFLSPPNKATILAKYFKVFTFLWREVKSCRHSWIKCCCSAFLPSTWFCMKIFCLFTYTLWDVVIHQCPQTQKLVGEKKEGICFHVHMLRHILLLKGFVAISVNAKTSHKCGPEFLKKITDTDI